MRSDATFLHADLDAFYASVEQLLDPTLRGRPIAVGGGVVLAASYEARAYGVRGGMAGREARRLCPDLTFVGGHFREYQRLGDQVIDVFRDLTPLVERISIDEAFLDVAGAGRLFGSPRAIAEMLRLRVREEVGLAVSVGAATTKHLAKVASQVAKPDGLVVVEAGTERAFLDPLPIGLVWGIGPATQQRLHARGISTIGQLTTTSPEYLRGLLGKAVGDKLSARAANDDARPIVTNRKAGSVGAQSACGRQQPTDEFVRNTLGYLADRVGRRLRASQRGGRTVSVRVRFAQMESVTRSVTLAAPVSSTLTLVDVGAGLVRNALADHATERVITLLGISVSGLTERSAVQLELPFGETGVVEAAGRPGSVAAEHRGAIDQTMDQVRDRFGTTAIGYLSIRSSASGMVPDEFRELAEH